MRRNILSLKPGESAYTPAHAAWIQGSHMYLNGNYPIQPEGMGTFSLRLVKYPNGVLAVDLSDCTNERFTTFPSFGDNVPSVQVDVALTPPLPNPDHRRICDMARDSFGFVSTASAWIHGDNMWLDGLAAVSQTHSGETPLLVERFSDGTFVIDNHFCQDALYQNSWNDSLWPVQVLKMIQSRRVDRRFEAGPSERIQRLA